MYSNEPSVTRTHRIFWGLAASAAITWGCGSTAQAAKPENFVPSKVVRFQDLNLESPEGAAVLYRRINAAAHEVCGDPDRYQELKPNRCVKDAVSQAIAQVDRPMLTSLYQEKTGNVDAKVTLAKAR